MIAREAELKALLLAAQAGDKQAYRRLLGELTPLLRAYLRRQLGRYATRGTGDEEDVVQEVLLAVHGRLASYDPAYPATAWIHAIARYKAIDHLRARGRGGIHLPIEDALDAEVMPGQEAADHRMDLDRMLAFLPAPLRTLIEKVKVEGRSIHEVAEATGQSESAVKVAIHRGLKRVSARYAGVTNS